MPKFTILHFWFEDMDKKLNELGGKEFKRIYSNQLVNMLFEGKYNHFYDKNFENEVDVRTEVWQHAIHPDSTLAIVEYEEINEEEWKIINLKCPKTGISIPLTLRVRIKEFDIAQEADASSESDEDIEEKVNRITTILSAKQILSCKQPGYTVLSNASIQQVNWSWSNIFRSCFGMNKLPENESANTSENSAHGQINLSGATNL